MKRQNRKFEKFDAFQLFSAFTSKYSIDIQDNKSLNTFLNEMKKSIEGSQKTAITIHGKRVEMLFAYVVGALGSAKLVKQEDAGNLFTANSEIEIPDYRVILDNGEQILVEVKSFNSNDVYKKFELKKQYFNKIKSYSELMSVELYISIYFRLFNQWVLLPIKAFDDEGDKYTIDFLHAIARSEMSKFGDCILGTTPNLELRLLAEKEHVEFLTDEQSQVVTFTPRIIEIYCNNKMLKTEFERNLAFYLMKYSTWKETEQELIIENGKFYGVKFVYSAKKNDGEDFASLGWRSSMVSEVFKKLTIKDDKVIATESFLNPSDFSVQIPEDYKEKYSDLPLWIFIALPNYNALIKKTL